MRDVFHLISESFKEQVVWNEMLQLYVILNFLEEMPASGKPDQPRATPSDDPYWRIVRGMQHHGQFLEGMLLKSIQADSECT